MSRVKQKLLIGKDESRLPGLQYDGDNKVYCGLCGKGFAWLGNHIIQSHHLSLDEYRERFNLNRTQPLCSPEYSAKQRASFIKRGMVEKYAGQIDVTIYSKGAAKPYRQQGKITLQDSPAVARRQIQNAKKSHTLVPCAICGKPTKGINTDKRKFYCPECMKAHDREYKTGWRETHRDSTRAACKRCRARHLEEYRRKDLERYRAKQPIRRILTQPCSNCGQITTGRTSRGKLYCPDCRRIRAHLYYLAKKATLQSRIK